jgi:hypothetical protein
MKYLLPTIDIQLVVFYLCDPVRQQSRNVRRAEDK